MLRLGGQSSRPYRRVFVVRDQEAINQDTECGIVLGYADGIVIRRTSRGAAAEQPGIDEYHDHQRWAGVSSAGSLGFYTIRTAGVLDDLKALVVTCASGVLLRRTLCSG